ncbi:glycosyltransferase family 2 protein [Fulvivirga sp. M361]|uniref:glycosyltransferase family 2 protein n=1 Tax=Fulvivirga sp. M361 TaxID=2594266 RepID=UPI00117AD64E|nr:glycosyltransferase family 2 protein [Fulvivirga sp. M361]TRX56006.1 glycosyltransferase family 2 protein [Fulvivirga sp. M361]
MDNVSIVILNFNGRAYLERFLPGVLANSPGCEVIVADNNSSDDSVQYLKSNFPNIRLIIIDENQGYSQGYNTALTQVTSKYYVLLNSDVEVTPGWVEPMVGSMDADPTIAAAQPKILDFNQRDRFEYAGAGGGQLDILGYPFCRGRLFLTLEKDQGQYDDFQRIFWATGACLFIRSDVFHELGGLDPDFFAHMEEIDLCWRINAAGYKVMYNGSSKVYHVGGGTLQRTNPRKTYLNFRNGLTLLYKNSSTKELIWKLPARIILDIIAAVKFTLFDSPKDGLAVIKANLHFLQKLSITAEKRRQIKKMNSSDRHQLIYKGSIVFQYFMKGIRKYNDLP